MSLEKMTLDGGSMWKVGPSRVVIRLLRESLDDAENDGDDEEAAPPAWELQQLTMSSVAVT